MQVISIHNNYASPIARLIAHIIDHLVVGGVLFSVLCLPDSGHNLVKWYDGGISYLVLVALGLEILYYAAMESSKYRATIGKIVMGITVEDTYGRGISFSKALLRNATKLILGFIAYIIILFDGRRRGLHDMIADTLVTKN